MIILISIILPVYNDEKGIVKTIQSIKNINYYDLEVIIINDGSTDNTKNIINKEIQNDSRFRVYNNTNHGCSYSRNYGLKYANGEYITFIDSGDTYYDSIFEFIDNKKQFDVYMFGFNRIEGNNIIYKNLPIKGVLNQYEIHENLMPLFLAPLKNDSRDEPLMGSVWRVIINRKLIEKYHISFNIDINVAEDLIYLLTVLKYCKNIFLINKPYYNYIRQAGTAIEKYRDDMWENSMLCEKLIYEIFVETTSKKNFMLRWKVFQFYQCTWAFSNISRSKNINYKKMKEKSAAIFDYFRQNNDYCILKEISFQRKIIFYLIKIRALPIIFILFILKEKRRIYKYE